MLYAPNSVYLIVTSTTNYPQWIYIAKATYNLLNILNRVMYFFFKMDFKICQTLNTFIIFSENKHKD